MSDLIDRQKAIDAIEDCAENANRSYKYDEELGLLKAREILIDAQPVQGCGNAISRERALKEMTFSDAIRTDDNILYVPLKDVKRHLQNLPSVQPEQHWETCFDCPLSHGCPIIRGCTNEQAMEYASKIPNDCPLSAQPERKKGKWIDLQCNQCGQVDMSKPNFCPNCGADMMGE